MSRNSLILDFCNSPLINILVVNLISAQAISICISLIGIKVGLNIALRYKFCLFLPGQFYKVRNLNVL